MTSGGDWQGRVGASWAAMARETDRSFAELTARLLERIGGAPGNVALDIGCGAGEVSVAVARARPAAQITGLDIAEPLIGVARERGAGLGNLVFAVGDAAQWVPAAAPDLLISRHGVMFFDDPVAAFAHLAGIAAPGAGLVFSCFQPRSRNAWAEELVAQLPAGSVPAVAAAGYAPGPFGFGDGDFVRAVLTRAGWCEVELEACDYRYIAGDGNLPGTRTGVADFAITQALAMFARIGPAAPVLASLPRGERAAADARLADWLTHYIVDGRVALSAAAWIVRARKA